MKPIFCINYEYLKYQEGIIYDLIEILLVLWERMYEIRK